MDDHLSSLGWSPISPRKVTHQMEVYSILGIWKWNYQTENEISPTGNDSLKNLIYQRWGAGNPFSVTPSLIIHSI